MLKLYKSNYTEEELYSMAEHCYSFCPPGSVKSDSACGIGCPYRKICCDFHSLANYCMHQINRHEYRDC